MQRKPKRKKVLVNKVLHTDQGTITFEGELTPQEVEFVIGVGLNHLLQMGALPFQMAEAEEEEDEEDQLSLFGDDKETMQWNICLFPIVKLNLETILSF